MHKPLRFQAPAAALAAILMASGPALAQTADDRTDRMQSDEMRGQDQNRQDRSRQTQDRDAKKSMAPLTTSEFVQKAAMSGQFEVESSEIAAERTESAEVSAFARQMVNDHTKANERLHELAQTAGEQISGDMELDAKHQKKLDELQDAGGRQFDQLYMRDQVKAHEKAVELFRNYAKNGDDVGLRGFAEETLPTLERHLEDAKQIQRLIGSPS